MLFGWPSTKIASVNKSGSAPLDFIISQECSFGQLQTKFLKLFRSAEQAGHKS